MKAFTAAQEALVATLALRFQTHPHRHAGVTWEQVTALLQKQSKLLKSIAMMEASGGEPDVVQFAAGGQLFYCDCAAETPKARVSLCYDQAALDARKEHKPAGSAVEAAAAMQAQLLTEAQYLALQELGDFDTKTSTWLLTPPAIRQKGGALFGDKRYGRAFIYHNGASSYYNSRGYRCIIPL